MTEYLIINKYNRSRKIKNNENFEILENRGNITFSNTNALFGEITYYSSDKNSINTGTYSAGKAGFTFHNGTMLIENFHGNFIFFQRGGNALKKRFEEMELIFANCTSEETN